MPLAEIEFRSYGSRRPRIVDYAAKWHPKSFQYRNTVRVIPAKLAPAVARRIREYALAAWRVLGCRDYARVDLRLAGDGSVVVLEVNPNPDISPQSGFAAALKAAGIPYTSFVRGLCRNALARATPPPPCPHPPPPRRAPAGENAALRWTRAADRDVILQFIKETAFFHVGEVSVAAEVLDAAIEQGPKGDYQSYTLTERGEPIGWICFGATPCTHGTFDVYWIAVAPRCQGRGYGRMLLNHAEKLIQRRRGRLVLIETSGRPLYNSTRYFYLAAGYHEVSRVPEFYAPNDDRVIYAKFIAPA
jgi:ribosomal protein S18 acetylase RimI-like enzyme